MLAFVHVMSYVNRMTMYLSIIATVLTLTACSNRPTNRDTAVAAMEIICRHEAECAGQAQDPACVPALVDLACSGREELCEEASPATDAEIEGCLDVLEALECGADEYPSPCDRVFFGA